MAVSSEKSPLAELITAFVMALLMDRAKESDKDQSTDLLGALAMLGALGLASGESSSFSFSVQQGTQSISAAYESNGGSFQFSATSFSAQA